MKIRSIEDIRALERQPYDEAVPFRHVLDILDVAARRHGDRTAITYLHTGDPDDAPDRYDFRTLRARVIQAANLFRASGVGPDESVALLMPNIPEAHFALWGAEIAARACPINHMLRPDHIVELLGAARARAVVALGPNDELDIWSRVADIRAALPDIPVFAAGADAPETAGVERFEAALARQPGDRLAFERVLGRDTPAACYHTGGTTGAPKLAQHTHGNQVHTSWSASVMYDLTPDDVFVNGFPLFHVAGSFVFGLAAFAAGASLLLPTRLGMRSTEFVRNYWRFVERERATILAGGPTVMAMLMNVPIDGRDIGSVRVSYAGGSPLPTALAEAFEAQTGIPVRNILGMTECAGIVTIAPTTIDRVPGSTGLPLPYTEVKAAPLGPDGPRVDETCAPDETGVIMLRGPHVGPGYTDPKRNVGTFTADGWLISGDLGHVDGKGQVFLTGRAKDVIIRGGHNIDPAMIEEAVDRHPAVEMSAAIGQPDAYAGELPIVYVTLKPGASATGEEILAFLHDRIAERPALPKRVVILPDLPQTAVGKIYKPALRAEATDFVLAGVLDGLRARGIEAVAKTTDTGTGLRATVTIARGGADAPEAVRTALRDFTFDYEIRPAG